MNETCLRHPDTPSSANCRRCGCTMCTECYQIVGDRRLCPDCGQRERTLRTGRGAFGVAFLVVLCIWVWAERDRWMTEQFNPQTPEMPKRKTPKAPPVVAKGTTIQSIADKAVATLEREPCDRRAIQEFIGAAAELNQVRSILTRAAAFERKCGDWGLLAMTRAQGHAQLSEWEAAGQQFDRWVKLAPRVPAAWSTRGRFRQERGNIDGAIDDYRRALLLEPSYTDVPQWLATLLIEQKRHCEAVPVLQQLFIQVPEMAKDTKLVGTLSRARSHPDCAEARGQGRVQVQIMGEDRMLDVDARIGGRPFAAVLDTGASYVTIPRAVANDLKLDLSKATTMYVSVVGSVREAKLVNLDKIAIGKARALDVPAIVVDDVFPGTSTILLGMSFLSRFRMVFDPSKGLLLLEAPGAAPDQADTLKK